MHRSTVSTVLIVAVTLVGALASPVSAAGPGRTRDITNSDRGRELTRDAADRHSAAGVATRASDLRVIESPDGAITVLPSDLVSSLRVSQSTDDDGVTTYQTYVDVGARAASLRESSRTPDAVTVTAAATPYWAIRETACFDSFQVSSAHFDVCYRITQLINDGSTSRNYFVLEVGGTVFEDETGLRSAWVSGERAAGSVAQKWEMGWSPSTSIERNCAETFIGVTHFVSIGQTFTVCEKWTLTKSPNGESPYMKVEWGCNFVLCSIKYADRDVAEAYQVSVVSGVTPRFRIGLGMAA